MTEVKDSLLAQLRARPWLFILDGLERILVAYHRIDAAELADEAANQPTDVIANRNPRDAIRDEDNDLLRALAGVGPSKILISSRLTPRVLFNSSDQPINGVKRVSLLGLRPADAEKLLRACGVTGDSGAIQRYLATNCDNHPLVIGILGGLIKNYLPARGDFDNWVDAEDGGARLDLATLDLVQRRNHILRVSLEQLSPASRQLLSTLALLSESVSYRTLQAFNPHVPPEPVHVRDPDQESTWPPQVIPFMNADVDGTAPPDLPEWLDSTTRSRVMQYLSERRAYADYLEDSARWKALDSSSEARTGLQDTTRDLELRGLLQFDPQSQRFDLHPVVRAVASGAQRKDEQEVHGRRVIDHFSSMPHVPYDYADTMEDVSSGLTVVRTLLKLGLVEDAFQTFSDGLAGALVNNLDNCDVGLSLVAPFFAQRWSVPLPALSLFRQSYVASFAAALLRRIDELDDALAANTLSIQLDLAREDWDGLANGLLQHSDIFFSSSTAMESRAVECALEIALMIEDPELIFVARTARFEGESRRGQWKEANETWQLLNETKSNWSRNAYRPCLGEAKFVLFQLRQEQLDETQLALAERLAKEDNAGYVVRILTQLRGIWRAERGEWALAEANLQDAISLARERGIRDAGAEAALAYVKLQLNHLAEPALELARLALMRHPEHFYIAKLALALGDLAQAKHHALKAYVEAWSDGEPYVDRFALTRATELLGQIGIPTPDLPPYDFANETPFPLEKEIRAAIELYRSNKGTSERSEDEGND